MIKLNWKFDKKIGKLRDDYICTSLNQSNLEAIVTFEYIPTKGGKSRKQCAFDVFLLDDDGYALGANRFETKKEVTAFLKAFFANPKSTLKTHWNSQNEEGQSSATFALDYIDSPKCKPELFAEVMEELEAEKKEETTESEIKDLFHREFDTFKTDEIHNLEWQITLAVEANNRIYCINMWDYENIDLITMAIDNAEWYYITN